VNFGVPVAACVFQTSLASAGETAQTGTAEVHAKAGVANAVEVTTSTLAGAAADRAFAVELTC
jgi:hypothetical protein